MADNGQCIVCTVLSSVLTAGRWDGGQRGCMLGWRVCHWTGRLKDVDDLRESKISTIKIILFGAGGTPHQIRTLTALGEDASLVPSTLVLHDLQPL